MENYDTIKQKILEISNDKMILIAGHMNSDMDSLGSVLALTRYLNKKGKKAYALIEEKEKAKIEWVSDKSNIVQKTDEEKFIFIMLDCSQKERLGIYESYFNRAENTIQIDHHDTNTSEAKVNLVMEDKSSTCEIIYHIIKDDMDKQIAELLYAGIVTDTYCFTMNMTPETFLIVSELVKNGIDYGFIAKQNCFLLSQEEERALADMITNMKYDIFHYIILDKREEKYKNIEYNTVVKKFMYVLENVKGIDVLAIFIIQDSGVTIEYRSLCGIDVSILANKLKGGGHKDRAGVTNSKIPLEELIEETKKYIEENQ